MNEAYLLAWVIGVPIALAFVGGFLKLLGLAGEYQQWKKQDDNGN